MSKDFIAAWMTGELDATPSVSEAVADRLLYPDFDPKYVQAVRMYLKIAQPEYIEDYRQLLARIGGYQPILRLIDEERV